MADGVDDAPLRTTWARGRGKATPTFLVGQRTEHLADDLADALQRFEVILGFFIGLLQLGLLLAYWDRGEKERRARESEREKTEVNNDVYVFLRGLRQRAGGWGRGRQRGHLEGGDLRFLICAEAWVWVISCFL